MVSVSLVYVGLLLDTCCFTLHFIRQLVSRIICSSFFPELVIPILFFFLYALFHYTTAGK